MDVQNQLVSVMQRSAVCVHCITPCQRCFIFTTPY